MANSAKALRRYTRFALELRNFLRHPISLEQAKAIVRQRLEQREQNFLRLVEHGIFGHPKSPYLPLLKLAHCELGDLQRSVHSKGLEATLQELHHAGVYMTFEEFKGRKRLERNGISLQLRPEDFDNPLQQAHFYGYTGGTSGPAARVSINLARNRAQVPSRLLLHHAHGLCGLPQALWYGTLPDSTGVNVNLIQLGMGQLMQRWFAPLSTQDLRTRVWKQRYASQLFVALCRLWGRRVPFPEKTPLDRADKVARWMANTLKRCRACVLTLNVSGAVRVCLAAQRARLDLTGAAFLVSSEPLTPGKADLIKRCGAVAIPSYYSTEVGAIGLGCAAPAALDDVHFCADQLALLQSERRLELGNITIPLFNLTTLLPDASKILLNVELDDFGVLEKRACGCLLGEMGLDTHLHTIRSFSKLTGEGVTLVGSAMERVLEQVLPARFGGNPLDYQLQEEELDGLTRLSLVISPTVLLPSETDAVNAVLAALRTESEGGEATAALLRQANTLRVIRAAPAWTGRGKFLPLYLSKQPAPAKHTADGVPQGQSKA